MAAGGSGHMTSVRVVGADLDIAVLVGVPDVMGVLPRVGELALAAQAPVTARLPWLAECLVEGVWALTVTRGSELVAAAVLNDDLVNGTVVTTLAGTAEGHRGALLHTDVASGRALGSAVAHALLAERRRFVLGPLGPSDALGSLLQYLRAEVTLQPVQIPLLRPVGEPESELSPTMRRNLRKARNRIATDGVDLRFEVVEDGRSIARMLPLILTIARDRDRACQRISPLDSGKARRRWRARLLGLAEAGVLRLGTLLLDDEVAAYVLVVVDADVVRVLDGRYVDRFARYAPGRLLEAALLEHVRETESLAVVDWMTTIGPESLLGTNEHEELTVVRGRSS